MRSGYKVGALDLDLRQKSLFRFLDNRQSFIDRKGVGGSISKGVTIKEITVFGDEGDSTIEGFKFQFNGLVDSIRNKRVIIEEISTERAEFIVAPSFFKDMVNEEEDAEPEETTSEPKPESEEKGELEGEAQVLARGDVEAVASAISDHVGKEREDIRRRP